MTANRYPHVTAAIFERPWAILADTLTVIVDLVRFRAEGGHLSADEVQERIGAAPTRRGNAARAGAVAVLPLQGVIMYRAGMMAQTSGAVSLESWMREFRSLMADEEIGTIVLDIDSPGGEVLGMPEAAAEIRAARDQKRIVAVANPMAASGAYWLGSQAGEFVVTPSGWVGSIGVYSAHEDLSVFWENEGVKTTLVSAGKFKVEGNEFEPLGDEAKAYRQGVVDDYYGMFVGDVAKGRGVTPAEVRGGMGQGRMVLAKGAKAERMVDGVMTLDEAIRKALGAPRAAASQALDVGSLAPAGLLVEYGAETGATPVTAGQVVTTTMAESPVAGPIASHSTATSDDAWDGPANEARLPSERGPLRAAHAWVDSDGDPDAKASYKFIHHEVSSDGNVGAANTTACSSGIAVLNGGRGGADIPDGDRKGVHSHLARHLEDAGKEAPELALAADLEYYQLRARTHRRPAR